MTTLPTWALFVVSFGTPIAALTGVVVGQVLLRRGANELGAGEANSNSPERATHRRSFR